MRGRDKTSGLEGSGEEKIEECLKKCDIIGNEVSMCIGRVATVTTLKEGITKEDALRDLSRKFILAWSEYVDKTSAAENTRREKKKGLIRKGKRMRNLIT